MSDLSVAKAIIEYNLEHGIYAPLQKKLSAAIRDYYSSKIVFPPNNPMFKSLKGTPVAKGYTRIVVGDYGAYVEFDYKQIIMNNVVNKFGRKWARRTNKKHLECSTVGDKRFSALCARLPDGRTIEEAYQLDIKGYRKFSDDWTYGKGKPPIKKRDVYPEYKELWKSYLEHNTNLLKMLCNMNRDVIFTDCFASGAISQARAIADILSEPDRSVKYLWKTIDDGSDIKIYEQRQTVAYADYKIGYWYIAPEELEW